MKKTNLDLLHRLSSNDKTLNSLVFEVSEEIDLEFLQLLVSALEKNTHITSIIFLDNFLSEAHANLIGSIRCTSLCHLTVQNNNICDKELKELLKIPTLQSLNISYNGITDEGAKQLAQHPLIRAVDISFNNLGNEGITALIASNKLHILQAEGSKADLSIKNVIFENRSLQQINLRNQSGITRSVNQSFMEYVSRNHPSDKSLGRDVFFKTHTSYVDTASTDKKNNSSGKCNIS
jgi:Ran GTPase-activating protein (RanGAP) involved in mRNA processing and transport